MSLLISIWRWIHFYVMLPLKHVGSFSAFMKLSHFHIIILQMIFCNYIAVLLELINLGNSHVCVLRFWNVLYLPPEAIPLSMLTTDKLREMLVRSVAELTRLPLLCVKEDQKSENCITWAKILHNILIWRKMTIKIFFPFSESLKIFLKLPVVFQYMAQEDGHS